MRNSNWFRRRRQRETTMEAAQGISTDLLTTSMMKQSNCWSNLRRLASTCRASSMPFARMAVENPIYQGCL